MQCRLVRLQARVEKAAAVDLRDEQVFRYDDGLALACFRSAGAVGGGQGTDGAGGEHSRGGEADDDGGDTPAADGGCRADMRTSCVRTLGVAVTLSCLCRRSPVPRVADYPNLCGCHAPRPRSRAVDRGRRVPSAHRVGLWMVMDLSAEGG